VQRGDQPQPTPALWARQNINRERAVHEGRPAQGARTALCLYALRTCCAGQELHLLAYLNVPSAPRAPPSTRGPSAANPPALSRWDRILWVWLAHVWTGWRSRRSAGRGFVTDSSTLLWNSTREFSPLTTRVPWIRLAPQESRNNHLDGNRPGPRGSNGASELWPVHRRWLLPWSPASDTSPASLRRHLPGDGSPRETRSAPPPTRRPPRVAVGSVWSAVWHDVRSLSGHLRIASRPRKRVWAGREPSIVTRGVGIACLIGVPTANQPGPGRSGGRSASDHRDRTRAPRCRCGRV
jgi:hypothetical protein